MNQIEKEELEAKGLKKYKITAPERDEIIIEAYGFVIKGCGAEFYTKKDLSEWIVIDGTSGEKIEEILLGDLDCDNC